MSIYEEQVGPLLVETHCGFFLFEFRLYQKTRTEGRR